MNKFFPEVVKFRSYFTGRAFNQITIVRPVAYVNLECEIRSQLADKVATQPRSLLKAVRSFEMGGELALQADLRRR
jgi:hypothetical protein